MYLKSWKVSKSFKPFLGEVGASYFNFVCFLGEAGARGRSDWTSNCSILPNQARGGLVSGHSKSNTRFIDSLHTLFCCNLISLSQVGYHRRLEDQLPVVNQASHSSTESQVQVGLCCTQAWKVQVDLPLRSFLYSCCCCCWCCSCCWRCHCPIINTN